MRKFALAVLMLGMLATASPAHAARAVVFKNGEVGCFTAPGDIPGMPGFAMPKSTLVIRADGSVTLACHGHLPDGLTLERTFVGRPPCFTPTGVVVFDVLVATKSGRVSFVCHFPAGSV
jgi:hypothetical protein